MKKSWLRFSIVGESSIIRAALRLAPLLAVLALTDQRRLSNPGWIWFDLFIFLGLVAYVHFLIARKPANVSWVTFHVKETPAQLLKTKLALSFVQTMHNYVNSLPFRLDQGDKAEYLISLDRIQRKLLRGKRTLPDDPSSTSSGKINAKR